MDKRDDTEVITLSNGVQILMPAAMPDASAAGLRTRIAETRSAIKAVIEDDHENEYDMAVVIADRVVAPLLTELRQLGDLYMHACRGAGERKDLQQRAEKAEANVQRAVRELADVNTAAFHVKIVIERWRQGEFIDDTEAMHAIARLVED